MTTSQPACANAGRVDTELSAPIYPDLNGKHVLITGGSNGIGAALCRAFARQRCRVTILDRDMDAGNSLIEECRQHTEMVRLYDVDLTDGRALTGTLRKIVHDLPVVDVLLANAGYDPRHELLEISEQDWDDLFRLNVKHYFVAARELLPAMIEAGGGSIIMTASHTVWLAKPELIAYNATKAAIVGMTRSLAEAVGKHGIRVNAVAPGWTMTERQRRQWVTPEAKAQTIEEQQVLPVEITPASLTGTYLFLASASSGPITRQTIVVDAGQSKH